LDEFDIHLHPHILPKLIKLFLDPRSNPKGAQLLISTHDAEILNMLGRYRTFLVNKVENESFGYRLDELPGDIVRNDRPILPAYNEGKIGGVPRL
jgi:predicted ATPase